MFYSYNELELFFFVALGSTLFWLRNAAKLNQNKTTATFIILRIVCKIVRFILRSLFKSLIHLLFQVLQEAGLEVVDFIRMQVGEDVQ